MNGSYVSERDKYKRRKRFGYFQKNSWHIKNSPHKKQALTKDNHNRWQIKRKKTKLYYTGILVVQQMCT